MKNRLIASIAACKFVSIRAASLRSISAWTPALNSVNASASTPVYQSVSFVLMRTGLNILAPRREPIPFAAQRADQLHLAPFIDPAPQSLNVDLDQIGERVEGLF